ncbi:endonuclease dU [Halosimplex sp. J119]
MKRGARALGVAESYRGEDSTLAGAVVRASRVVDGFAFDTCAVGGTDATETVISLVDALDREDVQYVLLAGIAPAWFNLFDLPAIREAVDRPVLSVTFEESPGLEDALRDAFDGDALDERLSVYRRQPDRRPVTVGDETVYVRAVGVDDDEAADVVRGFTPEGGRPEPLRVARLAARAADERFGGE